MAIKEPFHRVSITFDDGSTKVFERIKGRFQCYHNYRGNFQNPDKQWFEFHMTWIQVLDSTPIKAAEPTSENLKNLEF